MWSQHICGGSAYMPHDNRLPTTAASLLAWAMPNDGLLQATRWLYDLRLHLEEAIPRSIIAVLLEEAQSHCQTSIKNILEHLRYMHLLQPTHDQDVRLCRLNLSPKWSRIPHDYAVAVLARLITEQKPHSLVVRLATRLGLRKTAIYLLQQSWMVETYLGSHGGVKRWIDDYHEWQRDGELGLSTMTTSPQHPLTVLYTALEGRTAKFNENEKRIDLRKDLGMAWVTLGRALLQDGMTTQGLSTMMTARSLLEPCIETYLALIAQRVSYLGMVLAVRKETKLSRTCVDVLAALRKDLRLETLVRRLPTLFERQSVLEQFRDDFGVQLVWNRLRQQLLETRDLLTAVGTSFVAISFEDKLENELYQNIKDVLALVNDTI